MLGIALSLLMTGTGSPCQSALGASHPLAVDTCERINPDTQDLSVLRAWLDARDLRAETEHDPSLDLVHAQACRICDDLERTRVVRRFMALD